MASGIFIAIMSGSSYDKKSGETYTYRKGVTRVREGHAVLKLAPDYFVPIDDEVHLDTRPLARIERATAGPGERRGDA